MMDDDELITYFICEKCRRGVSTNEIYRKLDDRRVICTKCGEIKRNGLTNNQIKVIKDLYNQANLEQKEALLVDLQLKINKQYKDEVNRK